MVPSCSRVLLIFGGCCAATALALGGPRLPEPSRITKTKNYRDAAAASARFGAELRWRGGGAASRPRKKVAIVGGGLSGLACAKYLADAGHEVAVYEARDVLGGKVSAWQDADGDWVETGLHIFFGAYPNMLNLMGELGVRDRLQWKKHRMSFAMRERPGAFTSFEFPASVPAPLNMAAAILGNTEMLRLDEKVKMVPGLLPMLVEGQDFIDRQDELSVDEFMRRYGMPARIKEEIFVAMGKALDFIDPDRLSMTVILTAMNRFINEADGSQTAFLDGNQPDRLCQPIKAYIESQGGRVETSRPVREIDVDPVDGSTIRGLVFESGARVEADEYVLAMPVDVLKRMMPEAWSTLAYFRQLDELEGIPVINLQIWFDKKLGTSLDGLAFSRSPLLSVYADMSESCDEYADAGRSMLELVFAPATAEWGADRNWLAESDESIVAATLAELARLFPDDITPATRPRKFAVVRTPRSVYAAVPGRNKFRPSQRTPIDRLTLAGDFTSQKYLGSMEGAVLAGKLAADVVAARAASEPAPGLRDVDPSYRNAAFAPRKPKLRTATTVASPITYGGGASGLRPQTADQ